MTLGKKHCGVGLILEFRGRFIYYRSCQLMNVQSCVSCIGDVEGYDWIGRL